MRGRGVQVYPWQLLRCTGGGSVAAVAAAAAAGVAAAASVAAAAFACLHDGMMRVLPQSATRDQSHRDSAFLFFL